MNKADLVNAVSSRADISQNTASASVNAALEVITEELKKGNEVALSGFGKFSVRDRAARKARNPKTGESIDVPPSRVPAFKAGKVLKDSVG